MKIDLQIAMLMVKQWWAFVSTVVEPSGAADKVNLFAQ
jgi:hypothetical protein